ncbi:hypothetical protein PISMIDRAFT_533502 [Pisolithus microcarpus 441]|uniref:Uncharacterized protein n=1 Tax=Pisolithus microcarpus 441 TaxID=765257 RepID=A0A0C9YAN2_9AGAM|nr:hypothetical protein PISMIDRAFT_533502 [Pisolithus microcarpus 441]
MIYCPSTFALSVRPKSVYNGSRVKSKKKRGGGGIGEEWGLYNTLQSLRCLEKYGNSGHDG